MLSLRPKRNGEKKGVGAHASRGQSARAKGEYRPPPPPCRRCSSLAYSLAVAVRTRNEKERNKLAVRLFSTCIKTSSSDERELARAAEKYCPTPSAAAAAVPTLLLSLLCSFVFSFGPHYSPSLAPRVLYTSIPFSLPRTYTCTRLSARSLEIHLCAAAFSRLVRLLRLAGFVSSFHSSFLLQ